MRRTRAPWWFQCLVAVVVALCVRHFAGAQLGHAAGHDGGPDLQLGFWAFLLTIGQAIWNGIQAAATASLVALTWTVKALAWAGTKTVNSLKALGRVLRDGGKAIWEFSRATYDHVLKPAWEKFWNVWQKFRAWLDATFGPVLEFLQSVRQHLVDFWQKWIRPWFDVIDVTRRVLRVFSALGFDWARRLDEKLGALEDKLQRPFQLVLAKVNEIINLVNRVVTLDGLVQRVALIRSLERDYVYAWRAALNPWRRLLTDSERETIATQQKGKTLEEIVTQTKTYMRDRSGPSAPLLEEMTVIWRHYLVNR